MIDNVVDYYMLKTRVKTVKVRNLDENAKRENQKDYNDKNGHISAKKRGQHMSIGRGQCLTEFVDFGSTGRRRTSNFQQYGNIYIC